jgi:hypothetical protein
MRGCALNVRTRIKIINDAWARGLAWARGVIQLGRMASSTRLNLPSLLSRPAPPAFDALPSVLARIILLLPPGDQRNTPLLNESRWGAMQRQRLPKTLPCFLAANKNQQGIVYRLVPHLSGILHRLLSSPPVSDALDNSFAGGATYNDHSGNTGGGGGVVDVNAVESVAATVGGGEVLSVNSSDDSSDDEES